MARAVFFDRDGVLVRPTIREGKPYPPRNLSETELVPGAAEALAQLRAAGFLLLLITNQPDVARGTQQRAVVDGINEYVRTHVRLDGCFTCYHDDIDACTCRKPLPGLILVASETYHIDPKSSFVIGDRWRDIEAGYAAGCTTILIDNGYDERRPTRPAHARVSSIQDAATWILKCGPHPIGQQRLGKCLKF